jgi:hypothetical protein
MSERASSWDGQETSLAHYRAQGRRAGKSLNRFSLFREQRFFMD